LPRAARSCGAFRQESFEVRIGLVREHDFQGDVLVPAPPAPGAPFPMRRSTVPLFDHLGTVMVTGPASVGTVTPPPSTACSSVAGSSTWMSSPLRANTGCGRTATSIKASPARAAADPRLPFAAQAQDLAVARAGWNGDLEHLAVEERDLPLGAVDRVEEIDLETIMRVRLAHRKISPAPAAEYFRENVLAARKIGKARIAGIGRRAAAVGEVAVEALARPFGAGRVDLAAVEARPLVGCKNFFDRPLDAFFCSTKSCPSRPKGLGKSAGKPVVSMLLHGGCGYANL
jgi:hypothetical protein